MGDKDMNELFGKGELLIGDKSVVAIAGRTLVMPEMPEWDKRDTELKAFKDSLGFQIPATTNPLSFGMDFGSEPSKQVCSLIIQSKPIVNKPRNLKYPNKKRARRVWKKWAKRYGTRPGKTIHLPNVEVESSAGCVSVNVYQRKNGNNQGINL